jgi:hypothetical protein
MITAPQTTAFFTDMAQIGLPARTRAYLQDEGIVTVSDLADFTKKDSWNQVVENCKRPPYMPDPANPGALIARQPFRISAKSLNRLKVAAIAVEYYAETNHTLTAASVVWTSRLKNFEAQWDSIAEQRKRIGDLTVPKITKALTIIKFIEAYESYSRQYIGVRTAPLAYVIREDAAVVVPAPALAPNQPFSEEHGSV